MYKNRWPFIRKIAIFPIDLEDIRAEKDQRTSSQIKELVIFHLAPWNSPLLNREPVKMWRHVNMWTHSDIFVDFFFAPIFAVRAIANTRGKKETLLMKITACDSIVASCKFIFISLDVSTKLQPSACIQNVYR